MSRNASEMERAVARSLRDSLEKLQRNADEANQAISDLVSACSSAKPSNTLPHILRAQTAAASLAATLDVLSRFITSAMQPGWSERSSHLESSSNAEPDASFGSAAAAPVAKIVPIDTSDAPESLLELPVFAPPPEIEPEPAAVEETLRTVASESAAFDQFAIAEPLPEVINESAPSIAPEILPQIMLEPVSTVPPSAAAQIAAEPAAQPAPVPIVERPVFDVASLPPDQQELHRRANRVAKVSMQDIKMLRPADVSAGKQNNDLCLRLRDDIERAHKEYERRFHAILDHPVDYFYAWMVEILGEGDARALGEYPYPSAVARR